MLKAVLPCLIATCAIAQQDPVGQLQKKLADGSLKLAYDQEFGYLPDLLKALRVPTSSQGLVFSKTSLQLHHIHPQAPRAIYFNDDVYVGYVQGGDVIEVVSVDPQHGSLFFSLEQDPAIKPVFTKREDCLQCHQSQKTFDIPGLLLRSVWTLSSGYPDFKQGGFAGDERSPMKERWGGWYVSGTVENDAHMGNQVLRGELEPVDLSKGADVVNLDKLVNTNRYLTPHSDIIALLVLQHQVRVHNLLARTNTQSREVLAQNASLAKMFELKPGEWTDSTRRRIDRMVDELAQALLFQGEYQLKGRIRGTSSFAEEFSKLGPRDSKGRSFRDFDLNSRLLKYPCSWLVYSEAFDSLLPEIKTRVYGRMRGLLNRPEGRATLEILAETKPDFETQPTAAVQPVR